MMHMMYTGPVEKLKGEKALIRACDRDMCFAQFDNRNLEIVKGEDTIKLGFGWHPFPRVDFSSILNK